MIPFNFDPILLRLGFLQISLYTLVFFSSFIVMLFVLLNAARKKQIPLSKEEVFSLMAFLICGTIIGARLFNIIFWDLDYFVGNPIEIFYFWQGGFSFHGGVVGSILAFFLYAKIKKINFSENFYKLADLLVIPAVFFLALGRIANFINQEIVGKITNVPWCVVFENVDNFCRHPVQIYAFIGRFSLFLFLIFLSKTKKKEGFLFWIFIFFIALGRFFIDFLREDKSYFFLSIGQWLSLVMLFISIYFLLKKYIKIK